jgi:GDP-D-mannose dehydratase
MLHEQRGAGVAQLGSRSGDLERQARPVRPAKRQLGWEPKTTFEQLIRLMVDADHEAGVSPRAG